MAISTSWVIWSTSCLFSKVRFSGSAYRVLLLPAERNPRGSCRPSWKISNEYVSGMGYTIHFCKTVTRFTRCTRHAFTHKIRHATFIYIFINVTISCDDRGQFFNSNNTLSGLHNISYCVIYDAVRHIPFAFATAKITLFALKIPDVSSLSHYIRHCKLSYSSLQ